MSEQAKHTAGPWRILRQGRKSWVVAGGDPAKDPLDFDGQVIAGETTCPDWNANAHLIAAAPDLLAVAIATALFFADTDSPLGARARAALLKAEGKVSA